VLYFIGLEGLFIGENAHDYVEFLTMHAHGERLQQMATAQRKYHRATR
jgi:hypothetical protein